MSKLDDLHTLRLLLSEFKLPVSSILHDAIKEKEEELMNLSEGPADISINEIDRKMMPDVTSEEIESFKAKKRAPSFLRVYRADGTSIEESKAADTMLKVIKEIGADRVYALKIPMDGMHLVTKGGNPQYPSDQHDAGNGYFVNIHSSTMEKKRQLEKIFKALGLNWRVEIANKEKEGQYLNIEAMPDGNKPLPQVTDYRKLEDYVQEFANLSVGFVRGKKSPHKAILLLGIMHLIETGVIEDNKILLDKAIPDSFISCWKKHCSETKVPSVWIPFWFMKSESFWHFRAAESDDILQALPDFAGHPSIGQMRLVIKYAYFDDALFTLMRDNECREKLKEVLLKHYIANL